jgi:cytidylate kinase
MSKFKKYKKELQETYARLGSKNATYRELAKKHEIPWESLRTYARRNNVLDSVVDETLHRNNLPDSWSCAWVKDKSGVSVLVKNPDNKEASYEDFREDFIRDMKDYSPKYPKVEREYLKDPHLLVIDVADLHIGKLAAISETGEKYNSDIAVQFAIDGVAGIVQKSSGFDIERILFVIGNDILHIDKVKPNTTTSGTPQDVDGMWYDNFVKARRLYVDIIEYLITIADVHIVHNPSNHDYVSGFMLADSVSSWFRNSDNVTFDVSNSHRKYFTYYNSLIATSHGDGAKMDDYPLLMANEAPKEWADTKYRYVYLHHVHHKNQVKFRSGKDYHGVTVEYMRTPSLTDSWHHINGYQHAPKAVEGFIHSRNGGQVARITHLF